MRAVYTLIGLARAYGDAAVEQACAAALELDVISVSKIKSIVEKGTEKHAAQAAARHRQAGDAAAGVKSARFARDPREFATATGIRMQVLPGGRDAAVPLPAEHPSPPDPLHPAPNAPAIGPTVQISWPPLGSSVVRHRADLMAASGQFLGSVASSVKRFLDLVS
jgi:hypothetical protein